MDPIAIMPELVWLWAAVPYMVHMIKGIIPEKFQGYIPLFIFIIAAVIIGISLQTWLIDAIVQSIALTGTSQFLYQWTKVLYKQEEPDIGKLLNDVMPWALEFWDDVPWQNPQ